MTTDPLTDKVRMTAKVHDDNLARLDLDEELREMLAEVARESRSADKGPRRRGSRLVRRPAIGVRLTRPAVATLVVAAVLAAAAVPPVRAALGDLGDTLASYFDEEESPGRPLESSDNAPAWLAENGNTGQRVLASSGPYSLYLARSPSGLYNFGLDGSVVIGDTAAGWERQFADNSVVIFGPGTRPDAEGRVPLYGITAGNVAEVELRYVGGATTTASAQTGGFVLMLDQLGHPAEIVARDQAGETVQVINAFKYAREPAAGETDRRRPAHAKRHRQIAVPPDAVYLG